MRARLLLLLPLLLPACFSPLADVGAANVSCSSDEECPGGGVCLGDVCRAAGTALPAVSFTAAVVDEDGVLRLSPTVTEPGDTPVLSLASPPSHGSAAIEGLEVVYAPAADFFGADEFVVVLTREDGLASKPATAQVTVEPVDDDPVIDLPITATFFVDEDAVLTGTISIIDREGDACALTVATTLGAVVTEGFSFSYAPPPDFAGRDELIFEATCGEGGVTTSREVVVTPIDDAPRPVSGITRTVDEDDVVGITLDAEEVDGEDVRFVIARPPAHGLLDDVEADVDRGLLLYRPGQDFHGADSFSYCVVDAARARGPCAEEDGEAEVAIAVTPVDDPPELLTTSVTLSAVGKLQALRLQTFDADGDAVQLGVIPQLVADRDFGNVSSDSNGLFFTPVDHVVQRSGVVQIEMNAGGVRLTPSVVITLEGAESCAEARMRDPEQGDGIFLLASGPAFCDMSRRGGGFELVMKMNPARNNLRALSPLWTNDATLNESSIVVDGGEAKTAGAVRHRVDDIMLQVIDPAGTTRAVDLTLATPAAAVVDAFARHETSPLLEPRWTAALFATLYGVVDVAPACAAGAPSLEERFGVGGSDARVGGGRVFACESLRDGTLSAGVGLSNTASGFFDSRGTQAEQAAMLFIRSRDLTALGDAPRCEDHQIGPARLLLPGVYLVGGVETACGEEPRRGCGDGALDAGEQCDDGNATNLDGCNTDCVFALCGNGIQEPGEECEEGSILPCVACAFDGVVRE